MLIYKNITESFYYTIFAFLFMFSNSFSQEIIFSEKELSGQIIPSDSNNSYKIKNEVYSAFVAMQKEALKETINIQIVSSFRSFEKQQIIWNKKYKKYILQGLSPQKAVEKIIEYSTIPGTSRHHWGTDIDIIMETTNPPKSVLSPTHFKAGNKFSKLKEWLDKNAALYGFKLVYTNDSNRKGFKYEPWHFSYIKIAKPMLEEYLNCKIIENINHTNTLGNHLFTKRFLTEYLNSHILGIDNCLLIN